MDSIRNSKWRNLWISSAQAKSYLAVAGPNLIFDVLLHVISLADIATQSRVMKTCKSLYRYGARELLRSIEVHIPTEAKLHSFLLFMHADPSVRIPCLRGLSIYREIRISSQTRTLLTDLILRLAESERSVFWYLSLDYAKDLFLADNLLARAVGQLHSLTSVHMYSAGIQAAAVLQLLGKNSHLIDVSIGFQDKLLASSYYTAAQVDPVHLLRFSKDTLKSLTVKNWFLMTRTFTVYPRLRNLTIMGEWVPATPKLRRAFPNLSRLYVYGDPTVSPRHYASRRERNRNDQLVHGSWSTPWNCFLGELVHLYVLAPICHIQHILLEVEDWQSTDAGQLREVMADVRPEHLQFIPLELRSGETLLHDDWLDALSERRDPRLKVLQIDLEVLGDDEHADLGQALVSIIWPLNS